MPQTAAQCCCLQTAHNYSKQDQLFHMVLHLPVALAAVSEAVQNILAQEFGRSSICVPNAVDCQRFCPGPMAEIPPSFILTTIKGQVCSLCTDHEQACQLQKALAGCWLVCLHGAGRLSARCSLRSKRYHGDFNPHAGCLMQSAPVVPKDREASDGCMQPMHPKAVA